MRSSEAGEGEEERRYTRSGGEYIANTMDLDGRVRDLQIPWRKQHRKTEPCMRGDRGKAHWIFTCSQNRPTFSALSPAPKPTTLPSIARKSTHRTVAA